MKKHKTSYAIFNTYIYMPLVFGSIFNFHNQRIKFKLTTDLNKSNSYNITSHPSIYILEYEF